MTTITSLAHEFVDELPDQSEEGVLYISMPFATVMHLCCCGCRNKVYTPLRPNRWRLSFDGDTVTLLPSVGNWNFACRSHYWIIRSRVRWAAAMTPKEVEQIRVLARETGGIAEARELGLDSAPPVAAARREGLATRLKALFSYRRAGRRR
jgi:hypothetical protein